MRAWAEKARTKLRRHLLDALDYRGLTVGSRIEIERTGRCSLRRFEENLPGPRQILIESLATSVSPGSERVAFEGTGRNEYPLIPGYSLCGKVAVAGHGSAFRSGEIVAARGPHASLYLASDDDVVRVPEGVSPECASLTHIAFIALQGVQRARLQPGARVAVFGSGLIGQLAAQLAQVAGGVVTLVATSDRRRRISSECGLREFLNCSDGKASVEKLNAAVVIEASGSPQALLSALRASATRAQIVLLGSPKGVTKGIDPALWSGKEISIVGAHAILAFHPDAGDGRARWRRDAGNLLNLVADHRLTLDPLLRRRCAPSEAPEAYASLTDHADASVGIMFDWTREGPWRARVDRASPLRIVSRTARSLLGSAPARAQAKPTRLRPDCRTLGVGLIGCGEIAAQSADALNRCKNARIVFAADPTEELARSLAAQSNASYSANTEDLLAAPEVEAVLISTPHHLHRPLAIQALEAGKHVIVEKPMANTLSDCDEMLTAAERSGLLLSVCYCQRFDPRVQTARELLAADAIGTILGTRIVFGQYRDAAYWHSGLTGRTTGDWRARPERAGGGVLIMNACHVLDYVTWLVGERVVSVAAFKSKDATHHIVERSIALSYAYANGGLGVLEATTSLLGPSQYEQQIRGSAGQLTVAPELRFWSRNRVSGYAPERWHSPRIEAPGQERRVYFEAVVNAILDGTSPPITAREARGTQAIIEAAYLAADRERTVRLDELD